MGERTLLSKLDEAVGRVADCAERRLRRGWDFFAQRRWRTIRLDSRRNMIRQTTSWAVLVCFVVSCLGVPLPQPGDEKDLTAAFPCQKHACGCRSAAQCWQNCCCFTNREKLAWAKEQGVVAPQAVTRAAKSEELAASASCQTRDATIARGEPICRPREQRSLAKKTSAARMTKPACCSAAKSKAKPRVIPSPSRPILVTMYWECRGQTLVWSNFSPGLPLARPVGRIAEPVLSEKLSLKDEASDPLKLPAPERPPRARA